MEKLVIKILLVEDDTNVCQIYKNIVKKREDVELVSITNSSTKAIDEYKCHKPDFIILDLELNEGEGSGFDFIEQLKRENLKKMPQIFVTTNIYSEIVYNFCHKNHIDFIYYKQQKGYSEQKIIDNMVLLKKYESKKIIDIVEEDKKLEESINYKINKELDLIGVGIHLTGRKYLFDAIEYILKNNENEKLSIIQYLVKKYKKSSSTISRAMQNAIIHAWRITALEDLKIYYTARINYETGIPTPTEFIYYYVDKIRKEI